MEDSKSPEEDQSNPVCHKDTTQILKESTTSASFTCVTLRSSSTPSLSPYPAPGGPTVSLAGENDAKQGAVANGQVPPAASLWHMSREVPPRFRNHQEPKILLKRGQSLDGISPFLHAGDQSNANTTQPSASLSYANSTCGPDLEPPLLSQGMDKIVVDGSDLQAWPSIVDSTRQNEVLSKASRESNQVMQKNKTGQVELGVAADGGNSESTLPSSCETSSNSTDVESVQTQSQWEDNRVETVVETVVGPKQAEADIAVYCKGLTEAVQLSTFSSNLEALTPDSCQSRTGGEPQETGEVWGTSEENPVGRKVTGNNEVNNDVSTTVWDEESSGLNKPAATVRQSDMPKEGMSGHVRESSTSCLQDTQIITTNTTTLSNEKGINEQKWEGSECASADHGRTEDGTWSHSNSRAQTQDNEESLQSMISRRDLDPRVLCNTGWGQSPIKQGIAWDLEVDVHSESAQDWNAQIDQNRPTSPQWTRDVPGHVKGGRTQGAVSKGEQINEKLDTKDGALLTRRGNSLMEAVEDEQAGGWCGNRRDGGQHREADRGSWGPGDTQWGGSKSKAGQGDKASVDSEDDGWRSKQHQGWGNNHHSQHIPNTPKILKGPNQQQVQQPQSQLTQPRGSQESKDLPAGPVALNQSSGWKPGSIPPTSSAIEPSGWEEPSPQSISRKMEIDDGTSAWGDPTHYENRSVNMWERSNVQQRGQPSQQKHESMPANTPTSRDNNTGWERSTSAPEQVMDNSTAGWRKATDAPSGWRDTEEPGKGTGWSRARSNPPNTASKTMQDGWGDEGLNTSRHSSWEEDDGGPGMWANRSQENTSSFSSGGWNQGQSCRRTGAKGPVKGNVGGPWSSSVTRHFSNMGITEEDAVAASDRSRRGMNDFNGDMRRGGRGGGGSFRSHGFKEPGTSGVFNSGGHLRGMQQPGVHHVNTSPGVRAQVPQQFLPPQVSGSVLNPMFPPQLSPQNLAMLSGMNPHMQQVQLAYQLLLQQQQQQHFLSQRKFPHPPPPPLLPHQDPQQLARIMAVLQQRPKTPTSFPGFVPGVEPESLMGGVKEVGGAQPQFKWMMEAGHPLCPSPPDPIMMKNGLLPGPMKLRGDSSYPHYDLVENVGVASPNLIDNWHRSPGAKLGSAPNPPTWPPEFQPGVPWKGVQSPEPDPNPYSGILGENTLADTEHHLLQDHTELNTTVLPSPAAWPYCPSDTHTSAKFPAPPTSWPPEPIGHRTNRNSSQMPRPPPGLTHQKQSPWLGVGPQVPRGWSSESQESPFGTETSWSGGASTGSSWLLLSNLTPQINSSTLKTICLQHGPLMTFNLSLAQGSALIRYRSPEEAAKAQSALHMCVLGNTTILAEFVSEEDVTRYFTHSQSRETDGETDRETASETGGGGGGAGEVKLGWENLDRAGLSLFNQWSHAQEPGVWGGAAPGYHGNNLWGSPQVEDRGPGLLPGNLLGGGADNL